ncbi:UDP-N-acetylmuramoyl-L-alanyl-D-glutamate--2,6-diaminopimelate ligase [bacterium]|nr:UDP-N-acetylmuramoyl-L-alanyl-D-glutamate--2,6-diaminopimelate ligase [bacterium]
MKLKKLLKDSSLVKWTGHPDENIKGISYSSKQVKPHYLFAALKGEKTDGNNFIQEALKKGATAVLSENPPPPNFSFCWIQVKEAREALARISANFYSHPSREIKMVGITGTKGKTTLTYLLEAILEKAHCSPSLIGTIHYKGPHSEVSAQRTTPEAPDLQKMLREMKNQGATHGIVEVSSHALELKRVVGIEFDIVVFTNLSGEHMDYHKSMDRYFEAKKKLFSLNPEGMSVINLDDPWGKKLISQLPKGVITYGLETPALIHADDYDFTQRGIHMSVTYPAGKIHLSSPLLGKPNASNLLASVACALTLNIPVSAIKSGIASLSEIPGRLEKIENSLGLLIFVDYAHTDEALRGLLKTAQELRPRKILLVFGAGGDRDKSKRPRMGEVAGTYADLTILTSDNPRSENPMDIISDIQKGLNKTGCKDYQIQLNRRKAIQKALSLAEKGDCILVAGKGHENEQIIQDKVFPFNDSEVIRDTLNKMEAS